MGFAMGVMKMSRNDFEGLTVPMLDAVMTAYNKDREIADRAEWERMRLLATINIQPHVKKRITPRKLLPLPWDGKEEREDAPKLTRDESKARFKRLMKARGIVG